jgi:hypothetical protein
VVDQRGQGGRSFGRTGGSIGCGTIVIALIAALAFGVDPAQMLGGLQDQGASTPVTQQRELGGGTLAETCAVNRYSKETCDVLSSLNKTWEPLFERANIAFKRPTLHFYSQVGQSGCGTAQSAMGPFYCPGDYGIYIDTDFYTEMEQKLGASGDFARLYVIAHEYGHHIQMLTGIAGQIRSAQDQNPRAANQLQVRMELQADCYAGVWAGINKDRIDRGDMEEGLTAANAIGDDTLMRRAGRRPVESAFTHGSSAQRMEWLRRGIESASDEVCDQLMR